MLCVRNLLTNDALYDAVKLIPDDVFDTVITNMSLTPRASSERANSKVCKTKPRKRGRPSKSIPHLKTKLSKCMLSSSACKNKSKATGTELEFYSRSLNMWLPTAEAVYNNEACKQQNKTTQLEVPQEQIGNLPPAPSMHEDHLIDVMDLYASCIDEVVPTSELDLRCEEVLGESDNFCFNLKKNKPCVTPKRSTMHTHPNVVTCTLFDVNQTQKTAFDRVNQHLSLSAVY